MKGLFCSRCDRHFAAPVKCERDDCEHPDYHQVMFERFGLKFPPKRHFSLIGTVNSGKTFYLLTLLDALLHDKETRRWMKRLGIVDVEMIDPVSINLYADLVHVCKQGKLGFTNKSTPLGFFNLILTLSNEKIHEVVLFNSSGEKIEDEFESGRVRTNSHEMKGSVILYFVDPREDTKLNKILNFPKQPVPPKNFDLIQHTYKVMQFVNNVKLLSSPLAICISKFDLLLHRIPHEVPLHPFVEAHNHDFYGDIDKISERLSHFLDTQSQTVEPVEINEKFKKKKYFAIAPFGKDTENAFWDQRDPKGILAPFFWALKELEIIDEYGTD